MIVKTYSWQLQRPSARALAFPQQHCPAPSSRANHAAEAQHIAAPYKSRTRESIAPESFRLSKKLQTKSGRSLLIDHAECAQQVEAALRPHHPGTIKTCRTPIYGSAGRVAAQTSYNIKPMSQDAQQVGAGSACRSKWVQGTALPQQVEAALRPHQSIFLRYCPV